MQNDTFAKGEKNLCPSISFEGSFLQPNIAANTQR